MDTVTELWAQTLSPRCRHGHCDSVTAAVTELWARALWQCDSHCHRAVGTDTVTATVTEVQARAL